MGALSYQMARRASSRTATKPTWPRPLVKGALTEVTVEPSRASPSLRMMEPETGPPAVAGAARPATMARARPHDGTAYWIAGINDGAGGTSSVERVLYRRDTGGVITGLYRAGDVVDGATIATGSGIDFDFAFSGNNAHSMVLFNDAAQATTADARLAVNDVIVAGEGLATGQGEPMTSPSRRAMAPL